MKKGYQNKRSGRVSIRIAKKICDLQGKEFEILISCPYCSNSARLNPIKGEWYCKNLEHRGTEEELLELAQEGRLVRKA